MPRKDLLTDVATCQQTLFSNVIDVNHGTESGVVTFTYVSESLPNGLFNLQVLIPEPYDYPKNHQYILFVDNQENVPPMVTALLEEISPRLSGRNISSMIKEVARCLDECLSVGRRSRPVQISDDSEDQDDNDSERASLGEKQDHDNGDEEFDDFDATDLHSDYDDDIFFPDAKKAGLPGGENTMAPRIPSSETEMRRVRSDLRAAKHAGFKVGVLGDLSAGGIVCISIRVVKLGISEEAMQAWGLRRHHYLVLMIKFEAGYQTLDQVSEMNNLNDQTDMRVVLCHHYKPDTTEAFEAFANTKKGDQTDPPKGEQVSSGKPPNFKRKCNGIESLFIATQINSLLRERFPMIVRYRLQRGVPWMGAEMRFNDSLGAPLGSEVMANTYYAHESSDARALKAIVKADAIAEGPQPLSLPLVTMQFVLRHIVRCTEFCLVCHCKVENTFEALKPYVCSKPLCLYQYLNLGFGPSIEWEILSQPYVVDLLVSFCYVSARHGRITQFPTGLNLTVPMFSKLDEDNQGAKLPRTYPNCIVAAYDRSRHQLLFDVEKYPRCPVKPGAWIVLLPRSREVWIHSRVDDVSCHPAVILGACAVVSRSSKSSGSLDDDRQVFHAFRQDTTTPTASPNLIPSDGEVEIFQYDHPFDELSEDLKNKAINHLLDAVPSVKEMQTLLMSSDQGQHPTLRGKVAESALSLLRWIIASNRSCILQVDPTPSGHLGSGKTRQEVTTTFPDDRVSGMEGWMQFRFAQGAPDKEQRFVDSVNTLTAGCRHPTLFAWHGSPLSNWHSIIREGLHFKEAMHGRAYGDGVYMSSQAATSLGYSTIHCPGLRLSSNSSGSSNWPNSLLKINQALSLQEVVNAPDKFLSKWPHYVVRDIDWIQTRYLFIKGAGVGDITSNRGKTNPSRVYEQDPAATVFDERNRAVQIPITAVSKSRRPAMISSPTFQRGEKKPRILAVTDEQTANDMEDDANSIVSDEGDRQFLQSDVESDFEPMDFTLDSVSKPSGSLKRSSALFTQNSEDSIRCQNAVVTGPVDTKGKTDFIPGGLNALQLKILAPPKDASTSTTKALMKALKDALKVQDTTPLHELGWYIDRGLITNMYQWIVELHSFDPSLPLTKDMRSAGLTSIVLELRFTNSFPFSPPFVRVVRPRFLPFNAGGGGHVTAGGAICMELLTNNGWLVTNSIESVLLQIRIAMSSLDPRPARLEGGRGQAGQSWYSVGEAVDAYKRACRIHGWQIPADFDTLQMG